MRRSRLTIVLTGGGSGGHITPILAVAAELKRQNPRLNLVYIGQTGDKLGDIPAKDEHIDKVYTVRAGKFRRYHGEGWRQLLDLPTMVQNSRDFFYVLAGIRQSRKLLKALQPDMIFIKGGFVGVPVGLAAAQLHIPYITHDSDAIPGLANRLIARWADRHAVALPKDVYSYPANKTVTTGIPLRPEFVPVTAALRKQYRQAIDVPAAAKLLFIIGGGLGAQRVNRAVAEAVPHLLGEFKNLYVVHGTGRANEAETRQAYESSLNATEQGRVRVLGYIDDVYRYSGAADVIITRAGATNLAEFAQQGKACVVIPSPFLTGGHQLKNAQYLATEGAALVLDEAELTDDPNRLAKQVSALLADPERRQRLGASLAAFAKPKASQELAALLLERAKINRTPQNHGAAS
ncbi:MAG TPA: UDP-N-acetylglucosamine--N-acetylmuramyl-(pentapeptide) pyrophosphoryl-undecaprenol N-acetylglucosamine transferase [Candidatus Saccharimonadales bacterium]|nr:UDP-N-acetylglucosamine--N-acetylmuramyl-(pentapeptide) pyrophosphoryl-undecaprenol N-acetylglucosamine transferase [Candidatus Saccharimonadales bacterium]